MNVEAKCFMLCAGLRYATPKPATTCAKIFYTKIFFSFFEFISGRPVGTIVSTVMMLYFVVIVAIHDATVFLR